MGNMTDGNTLRGILQSTINALDATDNAYANSLTEREFLWWKAAADGAAGTATTEFTFAASGKTSCRFTDVFYVPDATLTASDTAYATLTVKKYSADGTSSATVASVTTQTTGGGGSGNWTAKQAVPLTLSTTAGAIDVAAKSALTFAIAKTGAGVVVPAGVLCALGQVI